MSMVHLFMGWLLLFVRVSFSSVLPVTQIIQSRDDSPDPEDFSFITGFAAIGDSYSAGIGAGKRVDGDATCARYDQAFPNLINQDARMGDPGKRTFQFLACSGAKSEDVLKNQIQKLGENQNLITMSVGGNDVGLSTILNACIFQWSWALSGNKNCEEALKEAQDILDNKLPQSLDKVIDAAKTKLSSVQSSAGNLYVTGYAKFFGTDSDDCDKVTWSFWDKPVLEALIDVQYLTKDRRQRMNDLVDGVNAAILAAVQRAGTQVIYVNYDIYVTMFSGRYCEKNVKEPDADRLNLFFYEWFTLDPEEDDSELFRFENNTASTDDSFASDLNALVDYNYRLHKDWEYRKQGGPSDHTKIELRDPNLDGVDEGDQRCTTKFHLCTGPEGFKTQLSTIQTVLPPSWLRVFHPRPPLHTIIANLILYLMTQRRADYFNFPGGLPEIASITACPTRATTNLATGSAPSATVAQIVPKSTYTGKGYNPCALYSPSHQLPGGKMISSCPPRNRPR